MSAKIGINCKAYYNSATWDSPTWVEIKCIENWMANFAWDKQASDSRASFIKTTVKTMAALSYSGRLKEPKAGYTDAAYDAMMESLLGADSPLDMLILNASNETEGAEGFRGYFHIYSGNEDQGLGSRLYKDVELEPADPAEADEQIKYAVVGASPGFTITYTDIPNDAE